MKEKKSNKPEDKRSHDSFEVGKASGEAKDWIMLGDSILCSYRKVKYTSIELIGDKKDHEDLYRLMVVNVGPDVKHVGAGDEIFAFQGLGYNFEYEGEDFFWCQESAVKWIIEKASKNE